MSTKKVAITINDALLKQLDMLVAERRFPSRSRAIQEAVQEKLERMAQNRLARECAKLNPEFEQSLAEEGMTMELAEWPEY
jgi:metal-responsive CopG/Arc/MetJ family transcriptional regulator